MNIINKIFGIQYIKVTYKVTDKNPYTDEHEEPQVKSIILEKDPNWLGVPFSRYSPAWKELYTNAYFEAAIQNKGFRDALQASK